MAVVSSSCEMWDLVLIYERNPKICLKKNKVVCGVTQTVNS